MNCVFYGQSLYRNLYHSLPMQATVRRDISMDNPNYCQITQPSNSNVTREAALKYTVQKSILLFYVVNCLYTIL